MRNAWTDESGLTLVELLMAMVLLAILLGIGFQGLQAFNRSAIPTAPRARSPGTSP